MDKRFLGILVGLAIIIVGIIVFSSSHNSGSSGGSASQPTNHVEGQGQDGIKLIEYGDYECPYCGEYFSIVKQVAATYNQQIYFQFRNLPLTELHPNAFAGARAAEAAGLMGKFWQMHDLLYEQNVEYYDSNEKLANWVGASNPETYFVQYAQQLGLNTATFKKDYASAKVNNLINADVSAFAKTGLEQATPTFILNGKQINPAESLASFEQIINAAIKKKGFTPPAGTSTAAPTQSTTTTPQSKEPSKSKQ